MERTPTRIRWPRDTPEQQTSKVGERQREDGARVCVCVLPYLHYLCAGMRDEVLLVGIYDSHLDQSIGLPVSAWGHEIITGYREEERQRGGEGGRDDGEGEQGGEGEDENQRWEGGHNPSWWTQITQHWVTNRQNVIINERNMVKRHMRRQDEKTAKGRGLNISCQIRCHQTLKSRIITKEPNQLSSLSVWANKSDTYKHSDKKCCLSSWLKWQKGLEFLLAVRYQFY